MTTTQERPAGTRFPLLPARPRADVPSEERSAGVAAIDFGTSSATVTINNDLDGWVSRAIWPAQAEVLCRGFAALLDGGPADDIADQIAQAVAKALPGDGNRPITTAADLVAQLRADADQERRCAADPFHMEDPSEPDRRTALLVATLAALERKLPGRPELAAALHPVYREAFSAPSLAPYRLTAVVFTEDDEKDEKDARRDVPSTLVLLPHQREVRARLQDWAADAAGVFPSVKRYLSRPRRIDLGPHHTPPPGWESDSDLLLGLAYANLVERTHHYFDRKSVRKAALAGRRVDLVTATFPTVTPPVARRRLEELLAAALGIQRQDVDTTYDEAVAAALYFVMRELGGDRRGGVDALRARSRRTGDGLWRRTLLVVDIGGGTTDIALLRLELAEQPSHGPQAHPLLGRRYTLTPRVLGTTGHAQLGGDLLTLRVLYWIKAVLVDAVLDRATPGAASTLPTLADVWPADETGQPVPDALTPLVVGFTDVEPVPVAVRAALREILPTHTDTAVVDAATARGSAAFRRLWNAAETAKRTLADGRPHPFDGEWLLELAGSLGADCSWRDAFHALAKDPPAALQPAEFARLARPVLAQAMKLAGLLARRRLAGTDDAVVDDVALAGRTCGMPLAEQVARETIGRLLSGDGSPEQLVRWNAGAVVVERENAKQAASVGAAWAHTNKMFGTVGHRDEQIGEGDDVVEVDVDNLLLDLPCGFDVTAPNGGSVPVLEAGLPLDRRRSDGTCYVRSRWMALRPDIVLRRRVDGDSYIRWGRFRYSKYATPLADVEFCIEMDQELTPTLLLRRGGDECRTAELVGRPLDLSPMLNGQLDGGRLTRVPTLAVLPAGERPGPDQPPLFAPGSAPDVWLAVEEDPRYGESRPIHCALSRGALTSAVPAQARPGERERRSRPPRFGVHVLTGPQSWRHVCDVELPHASVTETAGYHAALGADAVLRFLRDTPRPLVARTLTDMEQTFGAVFRTEMTDFAPDWKPERDPFNGSH